jgi:hypothetical protein
VTVTRFVIPTDVPTSMTEAEGLKLAELAEGKLVLELGAWQGFSTICLAQAAEVVHSVDWHGGDAHAGYGSTLVPYLQNLQRYGLLGAGSRLATHIGRFETICPVFADQSFHGVFVDGAHDYESVLADGKQALRLTNEWIAFHDYGVHLSDQGGELPFGVTEAVTELFGSPHELVDTLAIVRL